VHFNVALVATSNKDVATEQVLSLAKAGLNPNAELRVRKSDTTGEFILSQGTRMRGDPRNLANAQAVQATLAALNAPINQPQVTQTQ
jgi:hypothetical protein